mmetsp:Transcript_47190/g.76052  ORF Transcript_47190/g.76052 Transcript_47190/m.76052 type:complete len:89 (+) Transcript_47190:26-292(+)
MRVCVCVCVCVYLCVGVYVLRVQRAAYENKRTNKHTHTHKYTHTRWARNDDQAARPKGSACMCCAFNISKEPLITGLFYQKSFTENNL